MDDTRHALCECEKCRVRTYEGVPGVFPLRSINISGDRARIPSPVNDLSPKTWRFVTRFTSQS